MNVTVVPQGQLRYLSVWPAGTPWPVVSNLNSPDGSYLANAAIVAVGNGGALIYKAADPTDLIADVNGYFDVPGATDLTLYTITPCRAADTRSVSKPAPFGAPPLSANTPRDFPLTQSGCGIPSSVKAYSLNVTALPQQSVLGFLSVWPQGDSFPGVSTLNSAAGRVIANMAVVPAGAGVPGVTAMAGGNPANVLFDINGYFAPNGGTDALHYYPITPCRIVDTRSGSGKTGPFGFPALSGGTNRDFPLQAGSCSIPATVKAYALNVTVVPQGTLNFLSVWPAGNPFPGTSVLNSTSGLVIANAAIVPAGTAAGAPITVLASEPTDLVIDINGYFAP